MGNVDKYYYHGAAANLINAMKAAGIQGYLTVAEIKFSSGSCEMVVYAAVEVIRPMDGKLIANVGSKQDAVDAVHEKAKRVLTRINVL